MFDSLLQIENLRKQISELGSDISDFQLLWINAYGHIEKELLNVLTNVNRQKRIRPKHSMAIEPCLIPQEICEKLDIKNYFMTFNKKSDDAFFVAKKLRYKMNQSMLFIGILPNSVELRIV
ncbi:hypothetical protein QPK13_00285 [Photorhabdus tasmaniensis]|uniref:Uncharacterized protein n=1 Tax=Photorhabdus tasmaniensis TaxID=1004159 RepID=A0ABX0GLT2_9GAMM|nr:hypothetical protein [Photorhabdus tasmaniensis]NHB89325.1 hypothetical protein [Photorhabdus tasmaniensis]